VEFKKSLEAQGIGYRQLETKPSPFNTILWTANVEVEDAYLIGDYSFFDSQPITFKRYSKNHQLLGNLHSAGEIERLIDISNGWFVITKKESELFFNDLRFGVLDAESSTFVFSYRIVEETEGIRIEEVGRKPAEGKKLLMDLGNRILGN
jgi:inner membrane protein